MTAKHWRTLLKVLIMLTFISKAFGMSGRPPEGLGATRSVDLSGNVFQFAMPENFSRDMPADDLVERLDISDPDIFKIGRASCRERVEISVVEGAVQVKRINECRTRGM